MAIRTTLRILNTQDSLPLISGLVQQEPDVTAHYTQVLPAAAGEVALSMGAIVTARYIYIETDTLITLSLNGSTPRLACDGVFFLAGPTVAVTAITAIATTGASIKVFLGGVQ